MPLILHLPWPSGPSPLLPCLAHGVGVRLQKLQSSKACGWPCGCVGVWVVVPLRAIAARYQRPISSCHHGRRQLQPSRSGSRQRLRSYPLRNRRSCRNCCRVGSGRRVAGGGRRPCRQPHTQCERNMVTRRVVERRVWWEWHDAMTTMGCYRGFRFESRRGVVGA